MSISQKLEKFYQNQIENIKKEKNYESKIRQIGALVLDVGDRSISAISNGCNCCRAFIKKCYLIVRDKLEIKSNKNQCGRKKVTEKYKNLENDIKTILNEHMYTNPHFQTEQLFCSLTINEVMQELLNLGKYEPNFISRSALANLLNEMGYNLKKVKKNKPLKKIEETDKIFKNVKLKKEESLNDENTAFISIDTKDKVIIGPYSRKGKSRILVETCDHELTNECIDDYLSDKVCNKLVILLDNGPYNSGVRTAFLKSLVELSNRVVAKLI